MWLIHLAFVLYALQLVYSDECTLAIPRFRFYAPLIFSPSGKLITTDSTSENSHNIKVPANENVVLSCAPNNFKSNYLNSTKWIEATCKNRETFVVDGVEREWLKELGCERRTPDHVLAPVTGCTAPAIAVAFGYANPIKNQTFVLGEACYSETDGRTIFIHTKKGAGSNDISQNAALKTENLNYLSQTRPRSKYKTNIMISAGWPVNDRVKEALQVEKGPELALRQYFDLSTAPNGQLLLLLQLGWNYFVSNGVDHLPNFDLLHKDIVKQKNYELYMGTHSTLSLKNAQNQSTDIYLMPEEKKYSVPKYIWVVIKTDEGKAAAFAISNDINASEEDLKRAELCESKCTQMPWITNLLSGNALSNATNGFVWCCDLESFAKKVPEMPALNGKHELLV